MDEERSINLIPKRSFEELTTSRKLFAWMIGVGRVVVIATELIAVLVWLSRFKLDYEITTHKKKVEEKQHILEATKHFREVYFTYQNKLEIIKKVNAETTDLSNGLEAFARLLPQTVDIKQATFNADSFHFEGQTREAVSFAQLIASLLSDVGVENIKLGNTKFDPQTNAFVFALEVKVSKEFYR